MTDEEISQRLGSASADEAGMIAAMEFLETQTNLREQDNAAVAAWLSKMNASVMGVSWGMADAAGHYRHSPIKCSA